jgi:hypothetical protein
MLNSEIARASSISEIDKLGAVKSPASKPRRTALYCPSRSAGMSNLIRRKIRLSGDPTFPKPI